MSIIVPDTFHAFQESSPEYVDACELLELYIQTKYTLIGELPGDVMEKDTSEKTSEPGRSSDASVKMEVDEVRGSTACSSSVMHAAGFAL